jgi:phosphatidate cytidylyltransferase
LFYGILVFFICLLALCFNEVPVMQSKFWIFLTAFWIIFSVFVFFIGVSFWDRIPQLLKAIGGLFILYGGWSALVVARGLGVEMLLSMLCVVWAADIGAYFSGRRWGLKIIPFKLAPSISPGKSWEGVLGGFACVCLLGLLWWKIGAMLMWGERNLFSSLLGILGWGWFIFSLLALTAMSVVGDLMESFVKRGVGVKDSSQLLPGHGGVLDRIDALLPVLPMAIMLNAL